MASPRSVEFFLDPMCPWAYQTSRWIREVRNQTGLEITWRFFSLEEVNRVEGKKHPWEREWSYGWSLMRVGAWLRRRDQTLLDRWYETVGSALHVRGEQPQHREVAEQLAADAGLPADAVGAAIADPTTTDEVRADHEWLVSTHAGYGVPTMIFPEGRPLFGPVIVPAPTGDAAVRLWDVVTGWLQFPHLYEMRTPKTTQDWEHIQGQFQPYLDARSWQTIQRPIA